MADDKKIIAENEDGDSAEISANTPDDIKAENNDLNLLADIEKLKAEDAAKNDRLLRLQADFDNFRKRAAKEKTEIAAVIEQNFLKDLLPLIDNLSRAANHSETTDAEAFRKGIDMIRAEVIATLGRHGLEIIDTANQKFDPNFHQAVGTVQDDSKEDGDIAAEFQRGYMAHGRVIRPSMVQVVDNS